MRGTKKEKYLSIKELSAKAQVPIDDSYSLKYYIRSAMNVLSQAKVYQSEGDLQNSYIMLLRFCTLVFTEIPKHPEASDPLYKQSLAQLRKAAFTPMDDLEKLKPLLNKKYEEYQAYLRKREEAQRMQEALEAQMIYDSEHQIELERIRREQEDALWAQDRPNQEWTLQKALEGVVGINAPHHSLHRQHHNHHHGFDGVQEIQYPEHHRLPHPQQPTPSYQQSLVPTSARPAPALPRKPPTAPGAPKLPPKIQIEEDVHEFSEGLRKMIVPVRLLDRFLNIVRPNTLKKLETCGILAGVLSRNKLTVTTLIIPKQTATSDTCSTTNEDELFEFQMERDLMTLGWIHTHPTQTCFMSSVDLHTHCSYQLMLPEAIAIVCAPSHEKDYGVFRLTDPPGLQVITNCRQKPLFHQHPGEDDIYTDACDQGHVELVDMDLDIVDLRKK
ncbi:hypothetical protein BGZ83_011210 [Gryganskiella cystojenkinii]|nr:hypothetical protein BGZ83_011210 [Gryganskiella cystojenkinii]